METGGEAYILFDARIGRRHVSRWHALYTGLVAVLPDDRAADIASDRGGRECGSVSGWWWIRSSHWNSWGWICHGFRWSFSHGLDIRRGYCCRTGMGGEQAMKKARLVF